MVNRVHHVGRFVSTGLEPRMAAEGMIEAQQLLETKMT